MEGENNQLIWHEFAEQSTSFQLCSKIMTALYLTTALLNMFVYKAHGGINKFPLRLCVISTKPNSFSNKVC